MRGAAIVVGIGLIVGCRGAGETSAPEAWCAAEVLRSAEEEVAGGDGRLHALNRQFLAAHARARAAECERLAKERLVLRFAGGVLEARWKGRAIGGGRVDVLPPEFHPVKDVSHAVFLAALLFAERAGEAVIINEAIAGVDAAAVAIEAARVPVELMPGLRRILERTREALAAYAAGRLDDDAQAAYFAAVRPDLQANLVAVAGAVVRGLHAAVSRVRAEVAAADPEAWTTVVVIVGGVSHQARARDIGVQYFERLLAEPVAEGAQGERRLIVAEGVMDPAGQVGLAAAHAVDRVGGAVIFGEPGRLQRDALADDGGALDAVLPVPQDR